MAKKERLQRFKDGRIKALQYGNVPLYLHLCIDPKLVVPEIQLVEMPKKPRKKSIRKNGTHYKKVNVKKILELKSKGLNIKDISIKMGCSKHLIRSRLCEEMKKAS